MEDSEWTAWRVWCHPRLAREVIDDSILRIMEVETEKREMVSGLEEKSRECLNLSEEMISLQSKLDERDRELAAMRGELGMVKDELAEAHEELALHKSVDEKLAEFDEQLKQVEDMKRGYEKKIAFLENLLKLTKAKLRNELADEMAIEEIAEPGEILPKRIDMTVDRRVDLAERNCRSGMMDDAEGERRENKATELQRAYREKRAPGLPDEFPKSSGPDDWLIDLPEV